MLAFLGTSQEGGDEPRKKEEEQQTKQHKNKAKTKCNLEKPRVVICTNAT
jgi:hypothetical protein